VYVSLLFGRMVEIKIEIESRLHCNDLNHKTTTICKEEHRFHCIDIFDDICNKKY